VEGRSSVLVVVSVLFQIDQSAAEDGTPGGLRADRLVG
jgi:hypothetical protein